MFDTIEAIKEFMTINHKFGISRSGNVQDAIKIFYKTSTYNGSELYQIRIAIVNTANDLYQ